VRVELPLAWPGVVTAMVLTFAHTLGEFGIVLMVGGSIPGETKTIAIAIYDRVQAFDDRGGDHVGDAGGDLAVHHRGDLLAVGARRAEAG
jgi:ABC-type molybdate transport system permease subunit